jgi:hypothetical protein
VFEKLTIVSLALVGIGFILIGSFITAASIKLEELEKRIKALEEGA